MSGPGYVPEHLRGTPAGETDLAADCYRVGFRRLGEAHPGGVRFLAETQPLAEVVTALGAAPVEVCALVSAGEHFVEPEPRRPDQPVRVAYLGSAREEKGFHLLPGVVASTLGLGVPVEFHIQAWLDVEVPALAAARRELRRLAATDPRVTLYEQQLGREEFFALQRGVDVIVLPYDRRQYDDRGSGIFQEALAHGKPLVVPAASNPGAVVAREGNGVLFDDYSVAGVAAAVTAAVRDFAHLHQVALDARERLRAKGIGPVLDRELARSPHLT
jgi:glycosyltransferase involved in cell wall biosynthesis